MATWGISIFPSYLTPGIAALFLRGCFRQCHRLSLPLPILSSVICLLQIDVSHVFVVNVDLLAFAAVLVDHLFVYHDFLDELIENVKFAVEFPRGMATKAADASDSSNLLLISLTIFSL